ncbi:MAG: DnaD domain protein [Acholeplasmataceae bacterium]|nr:DnaD domain protein [Acholeplasmataceae bacterium]
MILKKLYEDYDLAIERILIKEYKRLRLTMQEMSVLLALFSIYKRRKTFSINAISRRVEFNQNEIGICVESLMDKGFMNIKLEKKDAKEREVFELDPTFKKIEELYQHDEIDRLKQLHENEITEVIKMLEQGLGRSLMGHELENIRRWYEEKEYTHEQIVNAIISCKDRVSIKYVERILSQIILEHVDIDQDVENALDEIYKKIK